MKVRKHSVVHLTTEGDSHTWCGVMNLLWPDPEVTILPDAETVTCHRCLSSKEQGSAHRGAR